MFAKAFRTLVSIKIGCPEYYVLSPSALPLSLSIPSRACYLYLYLAFWRSKRNRREFFEDYARRHSFDPLSADNWYHQSHDDILSTKVYMHTNNFFLFSTIFHFYICLHLFIFIYIYLYLFISIYIYLFIYIYLYYLFIHIIYYLYLSIFVYIYLYVPGRQKSYVILQWARG